MENTIRNIVRSMLREPHLKAIIIDELHQLPLDENMTLTGIRIDRECDIYLMDADNTKIDIKGLQAKCLYIFYLLWPGGISNRELCEQRGLLKYIYQEVCHYKNCDGRRIDNVISGMLDRKGGITDAVNKIRTALKAAVIDERLLKYYMIGGRRGCERGIPLAKQLIKVENDLLQEIRHSNKQDFASRMLSFGGEYTDNSE